ncbi:hypothetical protein [Rhodoblastus sp.]|uniref:hypothetical protein n=1 Tax=Rhodoblastus sp. TaxID=1962975 RepID=UPI003F9BE086
MAARRAVMMVVVDFLSFDEGNRFRVRGDFLDLRGGDFSLLAAFQKAFAVAHNGVVSKCFGRLNDGKRSTARGACRNGMAASVAARFSIIGLKRVRTQQTAALFGDP